MNKISDDEFIEAFLKSNNYSELMKNLNISYSEYSRRKAKLRILKLNLDDSKFKIRNKVSKVYNYSDEDFKLLVKTSLNYSDILRKIGLTTSGNSRVVLKERIKSLNIDISHFKITNSERLKYTSVLCKNSKSKNGTVKKYLFDNKLKENKCENCGFSGYINGDIYKGNVALDLHHIDGDSKNNEFNNLQILCPNCHRLADNFGSKNKRKFNNLTKSEIIDISSLEPKNNI